MSGIRQLGGNTNTNNTAASTEPTREERREDRRERQGRDYSQEDRDTIRENTASIRAATANRFGERSNPTRALTALAGYSQDYIKSKIRSKDTRM